MNGSENDMWCSKETIGGACIVVHLQHKFTTRNMQERTLEKSLSNGWNQFANLVTNLNINEENELKFQDILLFIFSLTTEMTTGIFTEWNKCLHITSATRQVRQRWFSVGIFPPGPGSPGLIRLNRDPQSASACSFLG
jgi:hypothetical protein